MIRTRSPRPPLSVGHRLRCQRGGGHAVATTRALGAGRTVAATRTAVDSGVLPSMNVAMPSSGQVRRRAYFAVSWFRQSAVIGFYPPSGHRAACRRIVAPDRNSGQRRHSRAEEHFGDSTRELRATRCARAGQCQGHGKSGCRRERSRIPPPFRDRILLPPCIESV
jgi:hypothetical protein